MAGLVPASRLGGRKILEQRLSLLGHARHPDLKVADEVNVSN